MTSNKAPNRTRIESLQIIIILVLTSPLSAGLIYLNFIVITTALNFARDLYVESVNSYVKKSSVCTAQYQAQTSEISKAVYAKYNARFGVDHEPTPSDYRDLQTLLLIEAKESIDLRVAFCDQRPGLINAVVDYCDKYTSPPIAPQRAPGVDSVPYRVKVLAACGAAYSVMPDDPIISFEYARYLTFILEKFTFNLTDCDMNLCRPEAVKDAVGLFVRSAHPLGKTMYCTALGKLTVSSTIVPSNDEYGLAMRLAAEAWNERKDADAAMCIAAYYQRAWGTQRDLPQVVAWLRNAKLAGYDTRDLIPDIQAQINEENARVAEQNSAFNQRVGIAAGVGVVACLIFETCRNAVYSAGSYAVKGVGAVAGAAGGIARDIAVEATVRSIAGVATNAGSDMVRAYIIRRAIKSVLW